MWCQCNDVLKKIIYSFLNFKFYFHFINQNDKMNEHMVKKFEKFLCFTKSKALHVILNYRPIF
jgi:hypothetical protein